MSNILIRAATVLTVNPREEVLRDHDVLIAEGRIEAIGRGLPVPLDGETIDARGAIVMPGLIDTHNHAWHHALREVASRQWGHQMYQEKVNPVREAFGPEDIHDSTFAAGLEMIDRGVTSVIDYNHAILTPEHGEAALTAHLGTGQRVLLGYGMSSGYPFPGQRYFSPPVGRRLEHFLALRGRALKDSRGLVDVGIGTTQIASSSDFWAELDCARDAGARLTVHQNTPGELTLLYKRGGMGPDVIPVHCNSASDQELQWLAETGTPISVNPEVESSVGRSLTIIGRSFRAGVKLTFGIDTAGRCRMDMFQQLKLAYTLMQYIEAAPLRDAARVPFRHDDEPPAAALDHFLEAGTVTGALALGHADLGRIAPGFRADLLVIRPHDPEVAMDDPIGHVLLTQPDTREIDTVIIDGVIKKRDGVLVDFPDPRARVEANRALRKRIFARLG